MSPKSFLLSDELHDYLMRHSTPLDPIRARLIDETARLGGIAGMQIAPEQSIFLTLLTRLAGVRTALEVGTFTGLSALSIAMGLPADGHLLCCDVSDEWTSVGRRYWEEAGVAGRIELRLAPAIETLRDLPPDPAFDLVFIDADKPGYVAYWEEVVPRLRSGGVVLVDNVLQGGRITDEAAEGESLIAIRAFNDHVAGDDRVELVMLPISDGLTLARKH
ncbi:MAG TPA: O-methyltransferase [Acidimicrobiales bacterium]